MDKLLGIRLTTSCTCVRVPLCLFLRLYTYAHYDSPTFRTVTAHLQIFVLVEMHIYGGNHTRS